MSERGTFVTSFLYDCERIGPLLEKMLPRVCRENCCWVVLRDPEGGWPRILCGLMYGSHGGEEAWDMENLAEDIVAELPLEHGCFDICVMPEWEQYSLIIHFQDRAYTIHQLKEPKPV